jgi:GntR family transcriptional repressor for pyruvate dehydrogenase complex
MASPTRTTTAVVTPMSSTDLPPSNATVPSSLAVRGPIPTTLESHGGSRGFRPRLVKTTSAADQIAQQLRAAIVSGQLQAGTRLSTEPVLAIEFGASRATVRDAIKILRAQGMVETVRGAQGGHRVATPQADAVASAMAETLGLWFDAGDLDLAEVDEARSVIELSCVRLAAVRRTESDLQAMNEALDEASRTALASVDFLEANVRFHYLIAAAARNRLLQLSMVAVHRVGTKTVTLVRPEQRSQMLGQHRRLLAAIEAQDPELAALIVTQHLEFIGAQRTGVGDSRP